MARVGADREEWHSRLARVGLKPIERVTFRTSGRDDHRCNVRGERMSLPILENAQLDPQVAG